MKRRILWAALCIFAMALVGMAGATTQYGDHDTNFVVSSSNEQTWDVLGAANAAKNPSWGTTPPQIVAGAIRDAQGNVIETFFMKAKYEFGRPEYTGYPSAAGYQEWVSQDNRNAIIYDANGNVIDTMSTPTEELGAILAAEYAANPLSVKGRPVFLYAKDTASGQGVPHGFLVKMSPELAAQ